MKSPYSLTTMPTIRDEFTPKWMEQRVMFSPCSPEASSNGPRLIFTKLNVCLVVVLAFFF